MSFRGSADADLSALVLQRMLPIVCTGEGGEADAEAPQLPAPVLGVGPSAPPIALLRASDLLRQPVRQDLQLAFGQHAFLLALKQLLYRIRELTHRQVP